MLTFRTYCAQNAKTPKHIVTVGCLSYSACCFGPRRRMPRTIKGRHSFCPLLPVRMGQPGAAATIIRMAAVKGQPAYS